MRRLRLEFRILRRWPNVDNVTSIVDGGFDGATQQTQNAASMLV